MCALKQRGGKPEGGCKNAENEVTLTGSVFNKDVTWRYTVPFQAQSFPLLFKESEESADSVKVKMQIPGGGLAQAGDFTATCRY